MGSEFDRLANEMDAELFVAFGEEAPGFLRPRDGGPDLPVRVVIQRNVAVAGPDGVFVNVQLLADLRVAEVADPCRGDLLEIGCQRYLLAEHLGADGYVNRFSLLNQG